MQETIQSQTDEDVSLLSLADEYRKDPDFFFESVLGVKLWSKEKEIVESIRDNIRTTVRSGNSSGKTYTTARAALWFLMAFPPAVVIDTAPTGRQVRNQFWREFRRAHKSAVKPIGGKLLQTQFNIDEDWYALGFSVRDGNDGMEAFQGWHAEHILVIVDEASGVSKQVFEAIQGALAGGKIVRVIYIGNPTRITGDFAESFKDPLFHKIHISAFDIPNVKENRLIIPGLATRDWVESMKSKYGEDSDVYRVRVCGEFPRLESDTMISIDLVESAIDADREIYGEDDEIIGLDPARFGDDIAAFVYRKGNKARVLKLINKSDTMVLAGMAKRFLLEYPKAKLHIDIIGLGAGIYDRLKEQEDISERVYGVNSAGKPRDDDYINIRAEGWANARDWLKDGVLEKHEGWYELAQPKYKITSNGKIQLESKDDMKKRGVKSPNVGDAFVLTLSKPTEGEFMGIVTL